MRPSDQSRIDTLCRQGLSAYQAGEFARAEDSFRQVIELAPGHFDALHMGGISAFQCQNYTRALQYIDRALALRPHHAEALYNRGVVAQAASQLEAAIRSYRQVLSYAPGHWAAHSNLAAALQATGQLAEAITHYRQAIALHPGYVDALYNLGNALCEAQAWDEAADHYRQALGHAPDHLDARYNLANTERARGRLAQAASEYEQVLVQQPQHLAARYNLATTRLEMHQLPQAIVDFEKVLELAPTHADAYHNLGIALLQMRQWPLAESCFRQALSLRPGDGESLYNLGLCLEQQRKYYAAADAYIEALQAAPQLLPALGRLVSQLQLMCAWDELPALAAHLISRVVSGERGMPPFLYLCLPTSAQAQRQCAELEARDKLCLAPLTATVRPTGERLRIGYLSGDFHEHATAWLMAELFELHDRRQMEVFAYSFGPDDGSLIRQRIQNSAEHFADIAGLSHLEAAQRIRTDGIDILVDLKGYTQGERAEILALRPAPVQVNWLGYPGTMGASFIDYILADAFIIPPGQEGGYSETVIRLPDCYQPNDRRRAIDAHTLSRPACGLPETGFIFCCFNQPYKITPEIFDTWMQLLAETPGSVLWLLEWNEWAPGNLRREAAARGMDPARLVFAPRLPLPQHLARYRLADLFIDTFPVGAHTTASDALWAGLPVLTLAGETFISRVAGSLLHAAGLPDLVTYTVGDYQRLALALAHDPAQLANLHQRLQAQRETCPLFNTPRFVQQLETAYRHMWQSHLVASIR